MAKLEGWMMGEAPKPDPEKMFRPTKAWGKPGPSSPDVTMQFYELWRETKGHK